MHASLSQVHPQLTLVTQLSMTASWQNLFQLPKPQRQNYRFHLVGIGGTGLGPIATVLLQLGFQVSGSDRNEAPNLRELEAQGAHIKVGHDPDNLISSQAPARPVVVLRSSAIPDSNSEIEAARKLGIPVVNRTAFLAPLTRDRDVIAVAGTHGKTTTTGMIAHILTLAGQDPGYIIGSEVKGLGAGHAGEGQTFVIEADEYDYAFLGLFPQTIVLTSLDWDHPDCFPTPADYLDAFHQFLDNLHPEGHLIPCHDDPLIQELIEQHPGLSHQHSYGTRNGASWKIYDIDIGPKATTYRLHPPTGECLSVRLQIPGIHNILNSTAALIAAHLAGVDLQAAASYLSTFQGAGRRFEYKGEINDIIVIDDYAHHPTEIRSTLAAARALYPDRDIWAIYQPHTYSRTKTLLDQFEGVFGAADHLIVTDIYAAREAFDPSITAAQVAAVSRHHDALAVGDLAKARAYLHRHVKPHSVIIILSAGTATQLGPALLTDLASPDSSQPS